MKNKIISLIAFLSFLLVLIPIAYAYPVTIQVNSNIAGFTTSTYSCTDNSCASFNSIGTHATSGTATNSYTITGSGTKSTAEYDYIACFLPHSYITTTDDTNGPGPWPYDIQFNKAPNCAANIVSSNIPTQLTQGVAAQFTATIRSPITPVSGSPASVPLELNPQYSPDTRIDFIVRNSNGNIVNNQTQNTEILTGTSRLFTFTWTPQQAGSFTVTITTTVVDCMCSGNTLQSTSQNVIVISTLNQPPRAIITANPISGNAPLNVQFTGSQSFDPDGTIISYLWNFGDATTSTQQNPSHVFLNPGAYTTTLTVADNQGATNTASVTITVGNIFPPPQPTRLNITSIQCFTNVINGSNQACSVTLNTNQCQSIITIRDLANNNALGSCNIDPLSNACTSQYSLTRTGNFTVYATTSNFNNCIDDLDTQPRFSYRVLRNRYNIVGLQIFNNSLFTMPDNDFFRNQSMFVKFTVQDLLGRNRSNMITQATLISPPGGRANLTRIMEQSGTYFYQLTPIPPNHKFKGQSQVFAFAFNFSDNSGGVKTANLTIRNNVPRIIGIPNSTNGPATPGNSIGSLDPNGFDVEDKKENLSWRAFSSNTNILRVSILPGRIINLTVTGQPGKVNLTLILTDLDGDSATHTLLFNLTSFSGNSAPIITSSPRTLVDLTEDKNVQYTYDVNAFDRDNDTLMYSLTAYPPGMIINSITGLVQWDVTKNDIGNYNVTVEVTDGIAIARQSYILRVIQKQETELSREKIFFNRLDLINEDCIKPGDDIEIIVSFTNKGRETMKDARLTANIDELSLMTKVGRFSVDKDQRITKSLFLEIPRDTQPGWYDLRVSAGDDFYKRIKFRDFEIKKICPWR